MAAGAIMALIKQAGPILKQAKKIGKVAGAVKGLMPKKSGAQQTAETAQKSMYGDNWKKVIDKSKKEAKKKVNYDIEDLEYNEKTKSFEQKIKKDIKEDQSVLAKESKKPRVETQKDAIKTPQGDILLNNYIVSNPDPEIGKSLVRLKEEFALLPTVINESNANVISKSNADKQLMMQQLGILQEKVSSTISSVVKSPSGFEKIKEQQEERVEENKEPESKGPDPLGMATGISGENWLGIGMLLALVLKYAFKKVADKIDYWGWKVSPENWSKDQEDYEAEKDKKEADLTANQSIREKRDTRIDELKSEEGRLRGIYNDPKSTKEEKDKANKRLEEITGRKGDQFWPWSDRSWKKDVQSYGMYGEETDKSKGKYRRGIMAKGEYGKALDEYDAAEEAANATRPVESFKEGGANYKGNTQLKGDTAAARNNNPGNLKWAGWMAKFGGKKDTSGRNPLDGGYWAVFPNAEAGLEAKKEWYRRNADKYRNLDQALLRYSGGGYDAAGLGLKFGKKKIGDLSDGEMSALVNAQLKREDHAVYQQIKGIVNAEPVKADNINWASPIQDIGIDKEKTAELQKSKVPETAANIPANNQQPAYHAIGNNSGNSQVINVTNVIDDRSRQSYLS